MNEHSKSVSVDINAILDAEKRAEQIVLNAKKEADRLLRHWNETMANERMKLSAELNEYKTKEIEKGMKDIDKEVRVYIAKKEKEADKISKKETDSKFLKSLIPELLKN